MLTTVLNNIFWIIVGIVVTRLLDERIARFQRGIGYQARRFRSYMTRATVAEDDSPEEYRLGGWHAPWVVVEGSTTDPYPADNVICQLDPIAVELPSDLAAIKETVEAEQLSLESETGRRLFHNGPTTAIAEIGRGQMGPMEAPLLVLRLRPSDYYTFLATAMSLDRVVPGVSGRGTETVRSKYFRNLQFAKPNPAIASALSVNLNVITSDGFIVLSKRATDGIAGYAGAIATAINESVNPVSDRASTGTLSLLNTAQRGAGHELNISFGSDELAFFTLGVDTNYYFWGITGVVRTREFSKADLLSRRSMGSKERWEASELYFLQHSVDAVGRFMVEHRADSWHSVGRVCLIQTAVAEFGLKATQRALERYR